MRCLPWSKGGPELPEEKLDFGKNCQYEIVKTIAVTALAPIPKGGPARREV